jgi:hypothetical protein
MKIGSPQAVRPGAAFAAAGMTANRAAPDSARRRTAANWLRCAEGGVQVSPHQLAMAQVNDERDGSLIQVSDDIAGDAPHYLTRCTVIPCGL